MKRTNRAGLTVLLGSALLLAILAPTLRAAPGNPVDAPSNPVDPVAWAEPALAFEDWVDEAGRVRIADLPQLSHCGLCDFCELSGGGLGHVALENPSGFRTVGTGWHNNQFDCRAGSCGDNHPLDFETCPEVREDWMSYDAFRELWRSMRAGDTSPVTAGNVRFNPARRGLEYLSCEGEVLAYLSIESAQ